uniref:Uncharacterized protein n=1 Tax=Plectus sambesii TaxID=2011161 RepID=A0A914XDB0_9BILA
METATRRAAGWVFLGSSPFTTIPIHSVSKGGADPTADGVPSPAHAPPIPPSGNGPNSPQSALSLPGHDEPFGMIRNTDRAFSMRTKRAPPPPVGALLARHSRAVIDSRLLSELAQQTRLFDDINDATALLERLPPVLQLIDALPESLPLLDAIYVKCHQLKRFGSSAFPVRALRPENILTQVLWWLAHAEDECIVVSNQQISRLSSRSSPPYSLLDTSSRRPDTAAFKFAIMLPHLQSLLRIIHMECGDLLDEVRAERDRLNEALEALGLHGLVNCSGDRLIRLADAARIELTNHHNRLKSLVGQLEKCTSVIKTKGWSINSSAGRPVPTRASHQRQMTLRVTEVCERMAQNEGIREILTEAVENNELDSLLRIVGKRVTSDKNLLTRFHALKSSIPPGYAVIETDPVVAKVLVRFKAAYDKLLTLAPTATPTTRIRADDSGVGLDDSDRGLSCSSSDTIDGPDSPALVVKRRTRLSGPVAQQLKARNLLLSQPAHHRSLNELPVERSALLKPVKSLSNLAISGTFEMYRQQNGRSTRSGSSTTENEEETAKLRNHINRLGAERLNFHQVDDPNMRLSLLIVLPLLFYVTAAYYSDGEEVGEPDIANEKRQMRASMVRFGKRAPSDRSAMVRFGKRAPSDRSAMVRFGRAPSDRSAMVRFGKRLSNEENEQRYYAHFNQDEQDREVPATNQL